MQIIDAGMLAFAAYHALAGRVDWPLTFQVPRMLRKLVAEAEDTYVLCWNGEDLEKRKLWPGYRDRLEIWERAGREDFEAMLRVLTALGAVQYRQKGREADEVIAALVHRFDGEERIRIRSDDKDFFQLLSGSTRMEGRVRGEVRYRDVADILGVTPAYVADYLALVGDEADDVPRIVPPRVARRLLASRGHIRDWIDRDLRIDERTKTAIAENRDQILLNLEIVDLSAAAVGDPGEPLLEGWGDLEIARAVGRRTDVGWLLAENLEEEMQVLRAWGGRTRQRLGR